MQQTKGAGNVQFQQHGVKTADPTASTLFENAAATGSSNKTTVFDELVTCMGRIVLPPDNDSRTSAPIASHVAMLREKFINAHSSVLACIQNMQTAWSVLATVSSGFDSPPEASSADTFNAQLGHQELQLGEADLVVNKTALSVVQSCDAQFQKLSDAAVSSLKRKDKGFMGEVYNRHATAVGFSARALVTALHAIDPSAFRAEEQVPDGEAAKILKDLDTGNKGHCNFEDFCKACKLPYDLQVAGADMSPARIVFLRLADVKGLTADALVDALKEIDAPVLSASEGCSPESIFRRADANLSGSVDLAESDPPCPALFFQPQHPRFCLLPF
jgi:hypothetical protein